MRPVMWSAQNSHIASYQYRGASERIDFNQIMLNTYYHLCNRHKIGAILKYQLFINKMFYRKVHADVQIFKMVVVAMVTEN